MKIKKLELVGFKSFVDRTVVNFDHEVLGIVGPNGCGKSNIVDAIRWAMGEQSAKHLRGRSMEDVLFNGSESRPATSFAEVTLTFENNDGDDVPIEYRDYPEIAVTRRLHRSGDSEYLINKTAVRLKDVTDLFLGTGVGTKAYSIVEQGKIGLIVSAKPEDRRMLIEEAAGITKFKSKRKQAEKKMELTQQNLLRVGDIVAEIERNLASLKRQAAKAERFISYKKELEDLQLHEASHKYLELTGYSKLEAGEVERGAASSEEAKGALTTAEEALAGTRAEAHAAEEALEGAHNEAFATENEVRAEEGAVARAEDKLEALRKRATQASAEASEVDAQNAQLGEEHQQVASEVTSLEDDDAREAEQLEVEEARLAEVTDESEKAGRGLREVREAAGKAQAAIASAEARLTGFERRKNELHTRLEKVRAEREDLEGAQLEHAARAQELERDVNDLRAGKVTTAEEKQRLEERLVELRRAVTESEKRLDEGKSELSKKRSRLHALEEMLARMEGVGAGVKALLATKDPVLQGLVADRIEAPADLTQALAGLLGRRLSDVVVNDPARGVVLLAQLRASKKGRAAVVVPHPPYVAGAALAQASWPAGVRGRLIDFLRFAPADASLVHALVGDAVVAEDVDAALGAAGLLGATKVVALDGTVVSSGRIEGGTGEEVVASRLDNKRETRALTSEVQRLEALVASQLAHHQAVRQGLGETQGALDRARQEAHQGELLLLTSEKDLRASQTQLEATRQRLETLAADVADLAEQIQDASAELDEARSILDDSRTEAEQQAVRLEDAERIASGWREQEAARRQVVTERKVHRARAKERLTSATATLLRLAKSAADLRERRQRLEGELEANVVAQQETVLVATEHQALRDEARGRQQAANEALAQARAISEALRERLAEGEVQLKGLRERANETRDALIKHEMAFREYALALQHLLDGISEKFRGLRLERVVGDYHLRPPCDPDSHSRINELTNLLERMGSVNLDAAREYQEAETRYAFYSTQKADLDQALADLTRAITQMNRESKKLFAETFEAVNARFQEIFPRMFRGGRASLRLTNPDDMLETGIDILAQPPGKKLSSIELMSGGEKALTAVSLIFAIFQIKPSPFCILDEVDAPLDEANVARYNEMVRSMTDRSQFILITHIKRTMQMVDVLYGVTMQESGVSRLVSVKLNEGAEKRRPALETATAAVA